MKKDQTTLVLEYKKKNDCKIFHSSHKLIASDSDIDKAFKSMHQSIMKKIKKIASEYCIVIEIIVKQIFECLYKHRKILIINSLQGLYIY